ncbi:3-isopropylmalate dehydratase large subunit [Entomobacter blattae]|uniref:3-isopropylmalate dehydratase large subunit n=1 Tax=Entomobacter blattae TaxID=2762277 RepID=A0A7H1NNT3_9PROT|nr:3-isopropylmalate dehydratase large subunit [Entomobacter blattae]QNT77443.1 3-isopropylmalate dehydratase large subunit [Entomobacter blattae]
MAQPRTLFEKIWANHEIVPETPQTPAMLYIDLHLIHEVTSPQAFTELRRRGLKVRRPERVLATMDHSTPTLPATENGEPLYANPQTKKQVEMLEKNCAEFGIQLYGWNSKERGIVHVLSPEIGATQPGMTIVCGDSHTSTHGAFGALAFGIGTTEVGHVLATQCLLQRRPKTFAIYLDGKLQDGVGAKDMILHIIKEIGMDGGTGYVLEYKGEAVEALSMEGRMTMCNMSIEAGARAGLIAPDETTFTWLKGRPRAPQGADWDKAVEQWKQLRSDPDAVYDREIHIDASSIRPTITYGTNPAMAIDITAPTPSARNALEQRALDYMHTTPGQTMLGTHVDVVFVGSCTNGRLPDLREAANILKGKKIASHVRMLIVPGSGQIKEQAEQEGLDKIFQDAGAEWREAGCSMCLGMNGDIAQPGQLVVSTSNRNFEGRQGAGARTVLASPATAATSAIAGKITVPETYKGVA